MREIEGGSVTTPRGYRAAGVVAGIKASGRKDLALIASDRPASGAAVYTSNRVQGAPIAVCREHLAGGRARAVILNSGNANACNGEGGLADARRMCQQTARALGMATEEVLVCSTGVIGQRLPMEVIEQGIPRVVEALSADGGPQAAEAMMTTDTVAKHGAVEVDLGPGQTVRVGAVAKGAAMISPNLATMLSVVTTDAAVPPGQLKELLVRAVARSFNCCTVDGDMSTSDTVIALANGAAMGGAEAAAALPPAAAERLAQAMEQVCRQMARSIATDGEGATKLIAIRVAGARTEAEARRVGLAVANSNLVKAAAFGNDPNWGRILCAVGYAGVDLDPERVEVSLCGTPVFACGAGLPFDPAAVSAAMKAEEIDIAIDLKSGAGESEVFTCDLTYEYVRLNAEYTT